MDYDAFQSLSLSEHIAHSVDDEPTSDTHEGKVAYEWHRFDLNMEIKDCAATCREFANNLIAELSDSCIEWKPSAFRTSNNNPVSNCRYNIIKLNWKDNDEALELIVSACDCAMNSHGLSVPIKCLPKTEKFLQI